MRRSALLVLVLGASGALSLGAVGCSGNDTATGTRNGSNFNARTAAVTLSEVPKPPGGHALNRVTTKAGAARRSFVTDVPVEQVVAFYSANMASSGFVHPSPPRITPGATSTSWTRHGFTAQVSVSPNVTGTGGGATLVEISVSRTG